MRLFLVVELLGTFILIEGIFVLAPLPFIVIEVTSSVWCLAMFRSYFSAVAAATTVILISTALVEHVMRKRHAVFMAATKSTHCANAAVTVVLTSASVATTAAAIVLPTIASDLVVRLRPIIITALWRSSACSSALATRSIG